MHIRFSDDDISDQDKAALFVDLSFDKFVEQLLWSVMSYAESMKCILLEAAQVEERIPDSARIIVNKHAIDNPLFHDSVSVHRGESMAELLHHALQLIGVSVRQSMETTNLASGW